VAYFEEGTKFSGSIKVGEYFDQLCDCQAHEDSGMRSSGSVRSACCESSSDAAHWILDQCNALGQTDRPQHSGG
jgi:hypothetical protein